MQEVDEYERLKIDVLETLDIIDIRLLSIEAAIQGDAPYTGQLPFVKSCLINLCATLSKLPSHREALQTANEVLQFIQFSIAGSFEADAPFVALLLRTIDVVRESFSERANPDELKAILTQLKSFEDQISNTGDAQPETDTSTVHFLPPTSARKLKALVVDSNDGEYKRLQEILGKLSMNLIRAQGGAEGILRFTQDPELDVILVNLEESRGADGHTFLEVIESLYQKGHFAKRTRCIVYSSKMTYPLLKSLLEYECVYAVRSAPVDREKVLETVLGVLSYRGKLLSLASA